MTALSALEELYASDPAEFTKKRDALAKELKAAGDAAGAAAIKARRKPTQVAWLLNTLTRKHPDAIADLVDVGRELAREQRKALRGEAASGLKDSIERQRKAIVALATQAAAMMKDLGLEPSSHIDELTRALQAALVDPAVGAQLEAGQLEKAPEAAVGFGAPVAPDSEPLPETKRAEEAPPTAEAPAKEDAKAARAAKVEAAMAARAAKVEAAKARAAHAKELAAAKAEARTAEAAATKARHAAEKAEKAARDAIAIAKKLADEAAAATEVADAAAKTVTRIEANSPISSS